MNTIFTISNTTCTESCLSESTNQKKEKSVSDLLAIACPERVSFGIFAMSYDYLYFLTFAALQMLL